MKVVINIYANDVEIEEEYTENEVDEAADVSNEDLDEVEAELKLGDESDGLCLECNDKIEKGEL